MRGKAFDDALSNRVTLILTTISFTVTLSTILGWVANIPILTRWMEIFPPIKFNAALCMLLTCIATYMFYSFKRNPEGNYKLKLGLIVISCVLMAIGAATLSQSIFNVDFGIDEYFIEDTISHSMTGISNGRMALFAAIVYILYGLIFTLKITHKKAAIEFANILLLFTILIALSSLISFIYGIEESQKIMLVKNMAFVLAVLILIQSIAIGLTDYKLGLFGILTGKSMGNMMARTVLLRILLFALFFGFVRINMYRFNTGQEEFGIVLSVLVYLTVATIVIWYAAIELNDADKKRKMAEVEYSTMHLFIKEAPTSIAVFDTEMRYVAYSRKWIEDYGLSGMDLIGKSHYEIFPEIGEEWKEIHRKCLLGETMRRDEDKFVRADGSVQWLTWEDCPWYRTDGSIGGIMMYTADITNIKAGQEELVRVNQKMSAILNSATQVSIISTDVDGVITVFSKGSETLLGYTADEMVGKQTPAIFHDEREVIQRGKELTGLLGTEIMGFETFVAYARRGGFESREWTYIHKDGSKFPVRLIVTSIRSLDNTITGFLGVATDVSELKEAVEARSRLIELEVRNKEMEQFTYIASHDLQEPLRTVANLTMLLEQKYGDVLDDTGKKSLGFLSKSANRMTDLVKGLLFYARIGRERKIEVVDINEVVRSVCEDLTISISERQANITVGIMPVLPAYKMELNQLFQNLISNAIKFSKKDKTPEILITAKMVGNIWQFAVQDNGIGIAIQDREKAFVLFRQLHNRGEYEGSGIGLAYCKKIVALHCGDINIDDAPGGGSIFYFTINPGGYEKT